MKIKIILLTTLIFALILFTTISFANGQTQTPTCPKDGSLTFLSSLAEAESNQGYLEDCMSKKECEEKGGKYEEASCDNEDKKNPVGCCYFKKCTSFTGYRWVESGKVEYDCDKSDSSAWDKTGEATDSILDANKDKRCCKAPSRGEVQDKPPVPGLLGRMDICTGGNRWHIFGWSQSITRRTTDPEEARKYGGTQLSDKTKDGKIQWEYKLHITPTECLFNDLAFAYGLIGALVLNLQGGDKAYGTCKPETPLKGLSEAEQEDACLSCMEDPYRLCTKERCEILGNCIAVPTEKGDRYNCIKGKCEDLGLVGIKEGKIEWYIDGTLNGSTDAKLENKNIRTDLGEIPFNTKSIVINLTTDQPAQCKWILDTRGANFSSMTDFEENYFPTLPDGSADWQYAIIELPGTVTRGEEHRIFIKCKNACGAEHEASYDQNYVQFKLQKKPDQLPPEIVYVDPQDHAVIRGDLGNITASFWLDELGNCKYSDKSMNYTINYSQMKYFSEKPNPNSSVMLGKCYPGNCTHLQGQCTHCELLLNLSRGYEELNFSGMPPEMQQQLEGTMLNTTKFFRFMIRCEDTAKNIMLEEDVLDWGFITMPGYNITVLKPEMDEKTYDRQPEIVVTSEPRETECKYKTYVGSGPKTPPSWDEMQFIDDLMATLHEGRHNETLNASKTGMLHTLWARCRDGWHIEATNYTRFYTLLDEDTPIVIRMYHDTTVGDYLIIETDENSTCVYGTSDTIKCNYNFSDGNAMMGNNELVHAAYWSLENLYYIKCKDEWNNYPGGKPNANACTAIINPYEVPPL